MIKFYPTAKFDRDAAILMISKEQLDKKRFEFSNDAIKSEILSLSKSGRFSADTDELFPINWSGRLILTLGIGKSESMTPTAFRISVRKALLSSYLKKISDIEIIAHLQIPFIIHGIIEAVILGTYAWKKYVTDEKETKEVSSKAYHIVASPQKSYEEAMTICEGVNAARDLVNDNADTVTSDRLERVIKDIVRDRKNILLEILNRKDMETRGLGLHLAVNQASRKEPKLIIVKYHGATKDSDYTALIGKGITFDTGGLNLKPTGYMETMRTDMSGAAAVIGALKNVVALNLKKNIIFAVAIAENAIGSGSFKPGDVFKSYSGKTVEIGNTDAEGRLVLADAISYVNKNYKPARIIDFATLTGACVIALGHDYSGLMSNNEDLVKKLLSSAELTDDRAWQLPIYPELKDHVKSPIADIKNTGLKGAAGALSAGEFLRQFTDDTPWAHFDIAGTAFVQEQGRFYYGHGATGVGVRLITDYLIRN